jgi:hypothetical protein
VTHSAVWIELTPPRKDRRLRKVRMNVSERLHPLNLRPPPIHSIPPLLHLPHTRNAIPAPMQGSVPSASAPGAMTAPSCARAGARRPTPLRRGAAARNRAARLAATRPAATPQLAPLLDRRALLLSGLAAASALLWLRPAGAEEEAVGGPAAAAVAPGISKVQRTAGNDLMHTDSIALRVPLARSCRTCCGGSEGGGSGPGWLHAGAPVPKPLIPPAPLQTIPGLCRGSDGPDRPPRRAAAACVRLQGGCGRLGRPTAAPIIRRDGEGGGLHAPTSRARQPRAEPPPPTSTRRRPPARGQVRAGVRDVRKAQSLGLALDPQGIELAECDVVKDSPA